MRKALIAGVALGLCLAFVGAAKAEKKRWPATPSEAQKRP